MRHPKNPFSSDEQADEADLVWPRDRREVAAEAAPGRGTPPPLPRRTGDSGFRPHGRQDSSSQDFWPLTDPEDFWPLTDPEDSWPLAPRPQPEPTGAWSPAAPEDSWRPDPPTQAEFQDPWSPAAPEDSWRPDPPTQAEPEDPWAQTGPAKPWPPSVPAQADPRDGWAQAGPQEPWPPPAPAQADPPESWGQGDPRDSWSPDSRRQAGPQEDDRAWDDDHLRNDERPRDGGRPWEDDRPRQGRVPAGSPDQDAGPAPGSMGFQDLWESWEPPYEPIGAISEPVPHPTAPYPELVRDAEYEDELGLWEAPAPDGPGGGEPYYPGPRRRAQHARKAGRPRRSGVFLALAGALAVAGAIPLGILGVRTLGHHTNSALKTAPLSANHAAASARGPNGAATFTALAGPGCPAAVSGGAFRYHAPNGDGWHPGTASSSGPCGSSFTFSYLAMVPGNPGEWHDHYAWIFHTGMGNPSCTFSFYIPAAPQANSTDYYWFSAGESNAVDRLADFTIDQATHQGQWVTKGPFTFPGSTVLIEATDRGEGPPTASVAVGPVRLSC